MRTIKRVISAPKVDMGGIILDQPLPVRGVDQIDPFLLVHHWKYSYRGGQKQRDLGVGPHPHRGFAPVTFIFKGGVHHRDSRGNDSIIEEGGTQWMNSGMGIVHSERPTKDIAENGGEFEIIQLWVNVPAKNKMDSPSYLPLTKEETPSVISNGSKIEVSIVTGEFNGVIGKIKPYTSLIALRLVIKKGGKIKIPIPDNYNTFLYQLDGSLKIAGGTDTFAKDLSWFNNDGQYVEIEGIENTRAILMAGEPINEKVISYGPFVMNTQTEIMQAMADYQKGSMGILIEQYD